MKKSTKAALLSALIFPGVGLYWLKQFKLAAIFIIPAAGVTVYIFCKAIGVVFILQDKMAEGSLSPDVLKLAPEVMRMVHHLILELRSAFWLLVGCWGFGIVASYVVGKKQEMKEDK